jgi:hypothetical protein
MPMGLHMGRGVLGSKGACARNNRGSGIGATGRTCVRGKDSSFLLAIILSRACKRTQKVWQEFAVFNSKHWLVRNRVDQTILLGL